MNALRIATLVPLLFALIAGPACADDLLPPLDCPGAVETTRADALVLQAAGREELVLGRACRIRAGGKGLPTRLAWVIPLPAAPDATVAAPAHLLADVAELETLLEGEQVFQSPEPEDQRVRRIGLQAVQAGDDTRESCAYRFHPLPGRGAEGAQALDRWLAENGFAALAPAVRDAYAALGWTWLAVEVVPPTGRATLDEAFVLPPLRVSFAATEPLCPLKSAAGAGALDLNVFWLTSKRPAYDNRRTAPLQMELVLKLESAKAGDALHALLQTLAEEKRVAPRLFRWLLRTHREGTNGPGHRLADWPDDPTLKFE